MDFHNFVTSYQWVRRRQRLPDVDTFYGSLLTKEKFTGILELQMISERNWLSQSMPYYRLYPGIVGHLCRLREDKVPASCVKLPLHDLCFRFAKGHEINGVQSVLASQSNDQLIIWINHGETELDHGNTVDAPVLTYCNLTLEKDKSLAQVLDALPSDLESLVSGKSITREQINTIIRCIVSCCLISQDEDDGLIECDVLNTDIERYKNADPERRHQLVERAKQRGKYGWSVGRTITVAPHWRGPCPLALYWTGPGRTVPKYRYRAGSLIHRDRIRIETSNQGESDVTQS